MSEKEKTIEEVLGEIDGIVKKMQSEDLALEDAFACYRQGLELVKAANEKIEKIECDIKLLSADEEL